MLEVVLAKFCMVCKKVAVRENKKFSNSLEDGLDMVGIYKITNKLNGKVYVGKSENITKIFEDCKNSESGSHGLPIFDEVAKYGADNFEFNVLEECSVSQLPEKELYYMNLYSLRDSSYGKDEGSSEAVESGMRKGRKGNPNVGLGLRRHIHKMRTDEAYRAQMIQKYRNNRPNAIAVDMMDKATGEILMTFPKIMEGARWVRENTKYNKADYSTINKVCKGNGKSAYGYKWQYTRDR